MGTRSYVCRNYRRKTGRSDFLPHLPSWIELKILQCSYRELFEVWLTNFHYHAWKGWYLHESNDKAKSHEILEIYPRHTKFNLLFIRRLIYILDIFNMSYVCSAGCLKNGQHLSQKILWYPLLKIGAFDFVISWIFRKKNKEIKKSRFLVNSCCLFSPSMLK